MAKMRKQEPPHRRGFARNLRRLSVNRQVAMLEEAKLDAVYVDGPQENVTDFLFSLRPGNEAVVCAMSVLAASRNLLRDIVADIHKKQCVIVELETGRRSDSRDDLEAMIFDAIGELASDRRPRKADLKKWGKMGGRPKTEKPTARAEAERIWFDARIKTVEEAAQRAGWHWRTMYRAFGPRGVSVGRPRKIEEPPFPRKSKAKRKTKRKTAR